MRRSIGIIFLLSIILLAVFVFDYFTPSLFKKSTSAENMNYHYSYFSTKTHYDEAYQKAQKPSVALPKNIRGMTVNHHLLAADIMAGTFDAVATTSKLTVVVISPNHRAIGNDDILTSLYDWQTPYGIIAHNSDLARSIVVSKLASVDEKPFDTEHGISALVAFIKKSLPNATIVPIIIKDSLPEEKAVQFAALLHSVLPTNSLVIASLDFSHYLPNYVSDFHDEKSKQVFQSFDLPALQSLDIDSKPTALIFLKYLELHKAKTSTLLYHTNANEITGNSGNSENTSYLNFVFTPGAASSSPVVTLLTFGDAMFDRFVRFQMNKNGFGFPFKNILRFLDGSDIVLANLEGPITTFPSITADLKNPKLQFTFDPEIVPTLRRVGFTMFGLANNHTSNFGSEGLAQTKTFLREVGIDYYGDPYNKKEISVVKEIRGLTVAFIGYHQFYQQDLTPVLAEIKRLRPTSDFIIVTPHWGVEYSTTFSSDQQKRAHAFIDAGADLVLGAHPHVIQPIEQYKNKLIFYSLGNFIFDQDPQFNTTHGLSVGITLTKDALWYRLFPITLNKTQVSLSDTDTRNKILFDISKKSQVPHSLKNDIIKGILYTPL